MGMLSWVYADCGEVRIKDGEVCPNRRQRILFGRPAFVPLPNTNVTLEERSYQCDGYFGGKDIYDLVADWNREFLSKNPDWIIPSEGKPVSEKNWYPFYADLSLSREEVLEQWRKFGRKGLFPIEYRTIGIEIACYDEDNSALLYPIKITKKPASYDEVPFSYADPGQGCD